MPNDWIAFLKAHKGHGLTKPQLSAKYRQEHGLKDNRSDCNKNQLTSDCKRGQCSWVSGTTVHRNSKVYPRKAFCRGQRVNWQDHCLKCGNMVYRDEWNKGRCNYCLKLNAQQHEQLGLDPGEFRRYRDNSLRKR